MSKTKQDFDNWNIEKQATHFDKQRPFYHEREIWWCALGVNVGDEQDGSGEVYYRPVLILKGLSSNTCLTVPLTTSRREHKYRPQIGKVSGKDARALLSQMRVIDSKRLIKKIGYLEKMLFENIKKSVRDML